MKRDGLRGDELWGIFSLGIYGSDLLMSRGKQESLLHDQGIIYGFAFVRSSLQRVGSYALSSLLGAPASGISQVQLADI
jgi:hypothetical protein